MKTWTKQKAFTYIVLFLLLAVRISNVDLVSIFAHIFGTSASPFWISSLKVIQDSALYLFYRCAFILVGIVIIVNRSDLKSLNIDGAFIAIFIAATLTYWTYSPSPSRWIALLVTIVMGLLYLYKKEEYKFAKPEKSAAVITMILVIGFLMALWLIRDSLNITKALEAVHLLATMTPSILVEEAIFRGLLWKFLTDLQWPELKIVGLQAILFWFSHIDNIFTNPIYFWTVIPIVSVILGIIVWRSRSITVSLFAHIFFNYIAVFI